MPRGVTGPATLLPGSSSCSAAWREPKAARKVHASLLKGEGQAAATPFSPTVEAQEQKRAGEASNLVMASQLWFWSEFFFFPGWKRKVFER